MNTLLQQYQTLLIGEPQIRPVDAAMQLGVSEAELLNAQLNETDTINITRLNDAHISDILKSIKKLGKVMALTRNASVVNEIKGQYDKLYIGENNGKLNGIAINPGGIDLRLFLHRWKSVFLVTTPRNSSVQFFDEHGQAVHKIYTTEASNLAQINVIKERFALNAHTPLNVTPMQYNPPVLTTPSNTQLNAFKAQWEALSDVHHFAKLCEDHNLERLQALELVGAPWSYELATPELAPILQQVHALNEEIMVFVGNRGAIQIYSGSVQNLKQMGPWYNVLDPDFNLHVKTDTLKQAFVVRKPTDNNSTIVTSIEFFDANRETVLTLFGRRQEGNKQSDAWQALCQQLCNNQAAA